MNRYDISLRQIYTANELHAQMAESLPLPDYYGGNLDALYDVLTEQGEGWFLHFFECDEAKAALGKYFERFQIMCQKAQSNNPKLEIIFDE